MYLVNYVEIFILRLCLKLGCPVEIRLPLGGIFFLQVESGDLEVGLQLVIDAVLLLSGLEGNADQNVGGLAPVLLTLVNVGEMLSNTPHLMK